MKRAFAVDLAVARFVGLIAAVAPLRLPAAVGAPPADRPWIERVERDRDRAAGRIVEDPVWETRRLREDREARAGGVRPRREFDRVEEVRDRQLQLDARSRRNDPSLVEPDRGSVILRGPPGAAGAVMSPMAAQAAADERALVAAKEKLERSLRGVNAAEQRTLRNLRRRLNRDGRAGEFERDAAPVRDRYEQLRAGHRADFERFRSRVLGRP